MPNGERHRLGATVHCIDDDDGTGSGKILNSLNLADVFFGLARRWPDRRAIISQHLNLSFAQLIARAAQAAPRVAAARHSPGANVGIGIRDSAETIVLMIALWMLGATAVPIDFRPNAAEKSLLASDFDLIAIIEDRQIPASGYDPIFIDASWAEILARHDGTPVGASEERPAAAAFISLTSGTTGRPQGIVIDHERMFMRSIVNSSHRLGTSLLNPLPLSFSASRTHTFAALLHGSAVYFHPLLFSAQQLAEAIQASGVTLVCAVPTIVRNLLELFGEPSAPVFDKLDALHCLGAPMFPAEKIAAKRVLCANFDQEYGSSLCGRISSLSGADLDARPDTLGRPLPHVHLQVVGADDQVLPRGETGVIRLRSPGMARCRSTAKPRALQGTSSKAVGLIPAISVRLMTTGSCASSDARPTSSSAAAPMCILPRSKPSSSSMRGCGRWPWSDSSNCRKARRSPPLWSPPAI